MQKKSKICIFILLLILAMVGLTSCAKYENAEETSRIYTYDDLSADQKVIVDGILDQYYVWKSVEDSGKDFMCTNVTFFNEDEKLIFATCYRLSETEEIVNGVSSTTGLLYMFFEVDSEGNLSWHKYSVYDSQRKNAAMVMAYAGAEFYDDLSATEKKDLLARELKD